MRFEKGSARPHLVLRLRKGWTFDRGPRRFRKQGRDSFRPGTDLPKYTRILAQVPSMARKPDRTGAEDELARGYQVVPPRGAPLEKLLERVQAWPCVEKAWVAAKPTLPAGGGSWGGRRRGAGF